jgi:magnesium-protoporphyrin IX monomethyl ester (oxidative) cyclase
LYPLDFYSLIYPFDEPSLGQLAYYFADRNVGAEYTQVMTKWIGKVREKITPWVERWRPNSTAITPSLFFLDNGNRTTVYDSRSGEAQQHEVGQVGREVLDILEKPKRPGDIAKEMNHVAGFDATKELATLQEKGLVFEENDRYLSLVLKREPANRGRAPFRPR